MSSPGVQEKRQSWRPGPDDPASSTEVAKKVKLGVPAGVVAPPPSSPDQYYKPEREIDKAVKELNNQNALELVMDTYKG